MRRILLALLVVIALDWMPDVPPLPLLAHAQKASAQAPYPPNAWHPYRGGRNCVQVSDSNGNFNCSPLVTIDPTTGAFVSVLGGPISTAVTLVVGGGTLTALTGDLVLTKTSTTTVAPTGPGIGGITLRARPSTRVPGYCMIVAVAGNSFGTEYPIAFMNPNFPLLGPFGSAGVPAAQSSDYFFVDLPGGPGGC